MLGDVQFGKSRRKRKRTTEEFNWTKYSIFFNLPYWATLRLRHNLDVMHIEKNIFDNIFCTLMNIPGRTKDNINSRRDLEILGFRKELHLKHDGERVTMPHALYTLHGDEKKKFCEWLADVKFPDRFASNISHCVSVCDCKISGLKSHDYHVFMQKLLPIAVAGFLQTNIALSLIELCTFFKELCARTLDVSRLSRLQNDIVTILCKLEMIFPPSFFDVMVHLAVHLPREAILGGPVQYRWMYPFERYLDKFKRYVKNKARPEGSIAEAYIHIECLTFCSMYLQDIETKFTRTDRNIDGGDPENNDGFKIFNQKVCPMGIASNFQLSDKLLIEGTWYVLNNCAEIGPYLEEHYEKCKANSPNCIDRTNQTEFPTWLKKHVQDQRITNPLDVTADLYALACGPERNVASYAACIINGKRFHTKQCEFRRRTQNLGVLVIGDESTNNVDFYGVITDIMELHYMGWRRVYLFMCDWFDVGDTRRGVRVDNHMTSINMDRTWYKDEPFVLACQASQCFYIRDIRTKGRWFVVQKYMNRNVYDIPPVPRVLGDIDVSSSDDDVYQENEASYDYAPLQCEAYPMSTPLNRNDVEPMVIDAQEVRSPTGQNIAVADFIDDGMIASGSGYASDEGIAMGESARGRGYRRGICARRFAPYQSRMRGPRGAKIASYHSHSEADQSGSDDSTQPPSHPWEPPCPNPLPPPEPIREPPPETSRAASPVREPPPNGDNTAVNTDVTAPTMQIANEEQPKWRRGPAQCLEFEKLRKYGPVILKINDGETAPCCSNAVMFTARVTQLIKQHCDMSYARWTNVPQAQKDELIDRVRGDFVLDWDRENHRLTVRKQLRKRFNAFHHELYKKYESYGSHDEALAAGSTMVGLEVWAKLCERWGTEEFKKIARQNRENRKALTINHTNEMVSKLDGLEPEQRNDEAAASVFREVLGHRPGYARGLGEMVIPELTRQRNTQKEREYLALIEKHKTDAENYKKDADHYKTKLDEVMGQMQVLIERQNATDAMMQSFFQNFQSNPESLQSHGET